MKTKGKEKSASAMPHAIVNLPLIALFVVFFPAWVHAGTWIPFGPKNYVRGTGTPVSVTDTFTLLNPATQYTLKAFNGGLQDNQTELVAYSTVTLNGVQVVGPGNFNKNVSEVDVPITPQAFNTLSVQVRGQPGGVLAIEIVGVDNDPPIISASISPLPNAAGWNSSNVTVSFTCSDKTSGVAFCPAPVAVTTEGGSQVISGTATDLAGNTATASVTVNLDKTPPNIFATVTPPPDASGWNSSAVTVNFACSDALSGVASCATPVMVTNEVVNDVITGMATDLAGNTASASVTVNISFNFFLVRSYMDAASGRGQGKCLDYGTPPNGSATVFLNDCGSAHPVRVTEADGNHDVVLHAGNQVIGIHNPQVINGGGPLPAPATQYSLELQPAANPITADYLNQVFALDGDSIILARSRPCFNSPSTTSATLCAAPPPQLVVQVQNSGGTNGSPLVAAVRNLSDNEFWDFNASDGSGRYPTRGFKAVATNYDLWNALCMPHVYPRAVAPPFIPVIDQGPDYGKGLFRTTPCTPIADPGTVVVVTSGDPQECNLMGYPAMTNCLDISSFPPLTLTSGVTLRGTRRGIFFGPQLFYYQFSGFGFPPNHCESCIIEVQGDYVRIAGLRLLGESGQTQGGPSTVAIEVGWPGIPSGPPPFSVTTMTQYITTVDHNDISQWGGGAIVADSPYTIAGSSPTFCQYQNGYDSSGVPLFVTYPCTDINSVTGTNIPDPVSGALSAIANDPGTLANLTVARNFLHHNELDGGGYGTAVARAFIDGNTYVSNRHAITAGGEPHNEYRGWYNMVLSSAPRYCDQFDICYFNQDTDMHGTKDPGTWRGGAGGYYVDLFANTFLGTNRANYWLRGYPAYKTDFHGNVSLEGDGDAVQLKLCLGICFNGPSRDDLINVSPNNQFLSPSANPTNNLGVGDFDGDGVLDTFMATGAAFYYAPGGAREWRFLSAKTDALSQVLLGDFDGDGRTDVVAMHGDQLVVSWGGVSDWKVLNATPCPDSSVACAVTDMAVGKFLAHPPEDLRDDIFYASGPTANVTAGAWYVSYGGSEGFNPVNTSSFQRKDLRFGDFNGDGKTDVFGVVSNTWSYSKSATGAWADGVLQNPAPPDPVSSLVVADFTGDGVADVGESCGTGCWKISSGGNQPFASTNFGSFDVVNGAVGHFGKNNCGNYPGADILVWNVNEFSVVPCGTGTPYLISSQDMR
jgi:hypothetical protein